MKAMIISFVCVLTFATQSLSAQNLTLEVRGIENVTGKLYVAIYNSQETFMKKPLAGFAVEVKDKVVSIPGKLDTGAFGIPVEKFGFSNDAEGVMGPPSYEKCSITFSEDTTLVVHLK